jgi:hypothetical protein
MTARAREDHILARGAGRWAALGGSEVTTHAPTPLPVHAGLEGLPRRKRPPHIRHATPMS